MNQWFKSPEEGESPEEKRFREIYNATFKSLTKREKKRLLRQQRDRDLTTSPVHDNPEVGIFLKSSNRQCRELIRDRHSFRSVPVLWY